MRAEPPMTLLATTALQFRFKLVLCCSTAILLGACGGATDEPDQSDNQQSLAAATVTEASVTAGPDLAAQMPDPAAPAADAAAPPTMDTAAPALPDAAAAPAAATTASAHGNGPPSNEFNLNGYQGNAAASSDAGGDGTTAAIDADGQQATQPTAG